ncbi:hypothetical protein C8J57DRAFT_1518734 [Mycena rebaudengoi]|nr:hypothetical protein C8J57DRAFT_1518734 [Mycena rebaudengoi]
MSRTVSRRPSKFLSFWKSSRSPEQTAVALSNDSSDIALPPEIWLEVFSYIPCESLGPLTLVSKLLRSFALPLYFRSQQFFPFLETFAFRRLNRELELPGYEERAVKRLRFIESPHIAATVMQLFASPYPPGYNRRHMAEHHPVPNVMRKLLGVLPKLRNLNVLVFHFPPCDATLVSVFNALRVDYLELEILPNFRGELPIPARKVFRLNCIASPTQIVSALADLRFTFPNSLESIVAGPTGADAVARALLQCPSGLPSLTTLDISLRFVSSPHFVSALTHCPALTALRLRRSSPIDGATPTALPSLPRNLLPHLASYHGPPAYGPFFAHGRLLHTARLWDSHSVAAVSDPTLLAPLLAPLGLHLRTLDLGVTRVPPDLVFAINSALPALTALAFNAHLDAFHPGSVLRHTLNPVPPTLMPLPSGLPPKLERLRVGAQLSGTSSAELAVSAHGIIAGFPHTYDPTSWRTWVVDRPWFCVEWRRCASTTEEEELDAGERNTTPGSALGALSIEYGEHYFRSFERGSRIASNRVAAAVAANSVEGAVQQIL